MTYQAGGASPEGSAAPSRNCTAGDMPARAATAGPTQSCADTPAAAGATAGAIAARKRSAAGPTQSCADTPAAAGATAGAIAARKRSAADTPAATAALSQSRAPADTP
jgi:hypothetical protein